MRKKPRAGSKHWRQNNTSPHAPVVLLFGIMQEPSGNPPLGWVLYDDSCGICRRWISFWAMTLRRRGYAIAPLQAGWVAKRLKLPPEGLLADILLLLPDDTLIRGADVYRHCMRRIWWAAPFYLLAITPGFRVLFDMAYLIFAGNRFRFSRACRLQPPQ